INCVIHTHTVAGCAVSMQKGGLLPLNQHALQVIGDVAYHDYEGTGRSLEERERFLADFGDKHIMALRNHGLFIVGRSIAEAFIATYRMERACAMQLAFQQSGAEFNPLSEAVVSAGYAKSRAGATRGHDPNPCRGPQHRREKPNPGARPHSARAANEEGALRHHDPRLQAQRHHHSVRRPRYPGRQGHRALYAAPPTSGVHPLSQCRRTRSAGPELRFQQWSDVHFYPAAYKGTSTEALPLLSGPVTEGGVSLATKNVAKRAPIAQEVEQSLLPSNVAYA